MATIKRLSLKRTGDKNVRKLSSDIQQQANSQPRTVVSQDGTLPVGMKKNDVTIQKTSGDNGGSITIGVVDSKGRPFTVPLNKTQISNSKSPQTGVGPPTTVFFPNVGDFGWYLNTTNGKYYFVSNYAATIQSIDITTLQGAITDAQHGNLSSVVSTHHAFTQISGTISDTQHGNLPGGSDHAAVTGSVNGFMIASDKALLDTATSAATNNALCQRGSGAGLNVATLTCSQMNSSGNANLTSGGNYQISGVNVVTGRLTGWNAPTGSASRGTFDTTSATTDAYIAGFLNALIADLRSVGVIGT